MNEDKIVTENPLLTELENQLTQGLISRLQVENILNKTNVTDNTPSQVTPQKKVNLQRVLYLLGGLVLFFGVLCYFWQSWNDFNKISQLIIGTGSALAGFAIGYYFYSNKKIKDIGNAFFAISIFLLPIALITVFDNLGIHYSNSEGWVCWTLLLFALYLICYYSSKAVIFLPFCFSSANLAFYSFIYYIKPDLANNVTFEECLTVFVGSVWLVLGFYFKRKTKNVLVDVLNMLGLIVILGSVLVLQGYTPNVNVAWEFIEYLLIIATLFVSVKIQEAAFLLIGLLFVVIEILEITNEYFVDSLGWPVALMISGILIMSIGYFGFAINKKFLRKKQDLLPHS